MFFALSTKYNFILDSATSEDGSYFTRKLADLENKMTWADESSETLDFFLYNKGTEDRDQPFVYWGVLKSLNLIPCWSEWEPAVLYWLIGPFFPALYNR